MLNPGLRFQAAEKRLLAQSNAGATTALGMRLSRQTQLLQNRIADIQAKTPHSAT